MYKYYPLILGIMEKIEEWNDKLNAFAGEHLDNALVGTILLGILVFVGFFGINALNKK